MQVENVSFTQSSRAFCDNCDFLKSRCLCSTLKILPNSTHIIVLQHPSESKHPLNTVRIMKKSFQNFNLFTGENFSHNQTLNDLIINPENNVALLYPTDHSINISEFSQVSKPITHLIVIDGTWRKAKKIFMLSTNLHFLSTIQLTQIEESHYKIRKAPRADALSTIEATIETLKYLEPHLNTTPAIDSFHKMIDLQIQKMGREIYQNNYLNKKKE